MFKRILIDIVTKKIKPKPKINCSNDANQNAVDKFTKNLKNTSALKETENIKIVNTTINFIKFLFKSYHLYLVYNLIVMVSIIIAEIILFFIKSDFLTIFILSIALLITITDKLYWYSCSRSFSYMKL